MVYPANVFDSCLRGDSVPLGSSPTNLKKKKTHAQRHSLKQQKADACTPWTMTVLAPCFTNIPGTLHTWRTSQCEEEGRPNIRHTDAFFVVEFVPIPMCVWGTNNKESSGGLIKLIQYGSSGVYGVFFFFIIIIFILFFLYGCSLGNILLLWL